MKKLFYSLVLATLTLTPSCSIVSWFMGNDDETHEHSHPTTSDTKNNGNKTIKHVQLVMSSDEFDKKVLQADKPVVVDFFATWCSACQALKPIFESLAHQLSKDYDFVAVDVDKAEDVAKKYGISGIPTILFFKNGKEVDTEDRHIGLGDREQLKTMIINAFKK